VLRNSTARAELAWTEGRSEEAQRLLQGAIELLQRGGAVMEAARTHLRLAELLALHGDRNAAGLELTAAEGVFQAAGAEGYLAHCRAVRDGLANN
jgi:hypothetical protein